MNWAPNENRTHSCWGWLYFSSYSCSEHVTSSTKTDYGINPQSFLRIGPGERHCDVKPMVLINSKDVDRLFLLDKHWNLESKLDSVHCLSPLQKTLSPSIARYEIVIKWCNAMAYSNSIYQPSCVCVRVCTFYYLWQASHYGRRQAIAGERTDPIDLSANQGLPILFDECANRWSITKCIVWSNIKSLCQRLVSA